MIADTYEPVRTLGNGSTVDFSFGWAIIASTNLRVYLEDADTGEQELQTSGFTVVFNDATPGGTVTFDDAPTDDYYVVLGRDISQTQEVDYKTASGFQGSVIQRSFDKLTGMVQDVAEAVARSIKLPLGTDPETGTTLPAPEAGKAIVGNADEDGYENSSVDLTSLEEAVEDVDDAVTASQAAQSAAESAKTDAEAAQAAAEAAAASIEPIPAGGTTGQVLTKSSDDDYDASWEDNATVSGDGTVGLQNLITNGDFENWASGTSVAPTGWTLAGASATVAAEGTIKKSGSYSSKVTRNGTNAQLYKQIHATNGITYWKGRTITLAVWVYATVADRARISIYDGVGESFSEYHTGDSTWQLLTVTRTISASATLVGVYQHVSGGDTSVYFDGAMCTEGSSIFAFSPKALEDLGGWVDYSAVSTVTGWSSFTAKQINVIKVGKLAICQYFLNGTSNATETSFTLPYTCVGTLLFASAMARAQDNSANIGDGPYATITTTNKVYCYKDKDDNTFTASGSKHIRGTIMFEIA